jgi:ribosome-binding factor A
MESSDPRLKGITITDANVDRELAYADIFVCTIEGSSHSKEVLNSLEHANGFLRHELAHRMDLRVFPKLRFHWDPTFEHADKIERLISSINESGAGEEKKLKKGRVTKQDGSRS